MKRFFWICIFVMVTVVMGFGANFEMNAAGTGLLPPGGEEAPGGQAPASGLAPPTLQPAIPTPQPIPTIPTQIADSGIQNRNTPGFGLHTIFIVIGVVVPIIVLIEAAVGTGKRKKTRINVYENKIEGVGLGRLMLGYSLAHEHEFSLEYNRIAAVDITKKTRLTINAFGRIYTIWAQNADHLAQFINTKLNDHNKE